MSLLVASNNFVCHTAEKTHPKDDVTNTVGSSCAPVTSPLAGYYPHEKTNPKSNVIVVDSQAYSADNESDDASERTNGRREVSHLMHSN